MSGPAPEPMNADVPPSMLVGSNAGFDTVEEAEAGVTKNRAKVGSARPSSLLYTHGPGAIMDLPNFSVMPTGLDDWEVIYNRLLPIKVITEPRLLDVVRIHLGHQVTALRGYPWQPKLRSQSQEGSDLGIQARVFPQWLRCTGCDFLGPLSRFSYTNTHPYRPDLAQFTHEACPGRGRRARTVKGRRAPAVPAQHLLTCTNGHLDEFPYELWAHRGAACPEAEAPELRMRDANLGKSVGSVIECTQCATSRRMAEAQGELGRPKLPQTCRGRHPHLDAYDRDCDAPPALIMMGASNLRFAATQSVIVMPRTSAQQRTLVAAALSRELGADRLQKYADDLATLRDVADGKVDVGELSDAELAAAVNEALAPAPSVAERQQRIDDWDPVSLLVPEWDYLQQPALFDEHDNANWLMVTEKSRAESLHPRISRVVAVNRMKKVNAVLGFTRLDQLDRVADMGSRLVKMTRNGYPTWVPATEDKGEGIFPAA